MHRSFIAALFFIFIACDDGNGGDSTPQDDLNAGGNATEETADTAEEDLSHLEIILPGQPTEDTTEGADGDVEIPPPNPGEFGAPCSDNDECYSGWCVSSPLGPVCTRNCDSDCPDGWFCLGSTSGADVSFICVPRGDRVCEPCAVDNQCGSGFCMQMDEGKRCTEGCRGDGDCLDGYSCKELESELSPGNFLRQCVPDFNSCDCLPGNEGLERPCSQNNAEGSCWGVQTCLGEEGWSACDAPVPTKEVCNGMDDNCNFLADDVEGRGDACEISNTYGTCTGVLNCVSGAGEDLVCVAQTPSEEVCNGMDDNCDGQIDEPFMDQETGRYTHVNACGNCFTDCEATFNIRPNAYGICDTLPETPTCVMACDTHYFDLNAVPGDGCEFYLDPEAIYVGVDSTDARDTGECGIGPAETGEGRYPCASITHGLARAKALNRKRLIIADGLYTEQVVVEAGIDLLGGHHTLNWERHVEATNTIVRGPSSTTLHAITLAAEGITVPTLIEGLVLYGPTSFAESKNAYAVWIRNSDNNLQLRDNLIFGGDAGDGASGNAGQDGNDGAHGQVGERAMSTTVWRTTECQADSNTPGNIAPCRNSAGNWTSDACGLAGSTMCGSVDVSGGAGAGAVCPVDTDIQPGGTNGKGSSATGTPGTGGIGGMDKFTPGSSGNCGTYYNGGKTPNGAHGQDGGRGQDRRGGNGCTEASGSIQSGHWVPAAAPVGLAGQHGGGGGGGGAGGGKDVTNGTCYNGTTRVDELGGSGGGGGAGGCGGAPGNGGQGGGASIAVMIYNLTPPSASALPVLSGNVISLGTGGKGGQGGSAGKGGRGGNGGNGGKALDSIMGEGGRGGQGGDGGHGGGGGGGCGGPAFGIYVHGYSGTPNYTPANTFVESGNGGPGGRGGASPGQPGQDGNDGFVKNTNYAP